MSLVQKTDWVIQKGSLVFYEDFKDLDKFIDSGKIHTLTM